MTDNRFREWEKIREWAEQPREIEDSKWYVYEIDEDGDLNIIASFYDYREAQALAIKVDGIYTRY